MTTIQSIGITPARVAQLLGRKTPNDKPQYDMPKPIKNAWVTGHMNLQPIIGTLYPAQVVALRNERASGATLRALAAKYGICASAVCKIARGHSYGSIQGPITHGRVK
jgi:hypothetical protein